MKKKFLLLLPAVIVLAGCPRTENLYERSAYNKGFLQDYYTDFTGLDKVNVERIDVGNLTIVNHLSSSFDTKMADKNDFYRHGILSKLYDGQVDCQQKYQLARVQLNNNGFATKIAEPMNVGQIQLSIRGGSSCEQPLERDLNFNLHITLYTPTKIYNVDPETVAVPTDNHARTRLFDITFDTVQGVYGYGIKFECTNFLTQSSVTPNDELSLMVYEVVLK